MACSSRPTSYNLAVCNSFYNQPLWTEYRHQDYYDDDDYGDSDSISSYGDEYDDIIWPQTLELMRLPEMEAIGLRYMGRSWVAALQEEFFKPYFRNLALSVYERRREDQYHVSPTQDKVFNWTRYCRIDEVRAVILAQDPYTNQRLAQGLAFSVENFMSMPRRSRSSLTNISKAVDYSIYGIPIDSPDFELPTHGDLTPWAVQGVVLLNSCLTVGREAGSHSDIGWQKFTDAVIKYLNRSCQNVVFMQWGNLAKAKEKFINQSRHLVLQTTHPSPWSARYGFLKCDHFYIANEYLLYHQNGPAINWCGAFWPDGH